MKNKFVLASIIAFLSAPIPIHAQGYIFDQQSTNLIEGGIGIQSGQPMGQSFIPNLSSISFVMLFLYDGDFINNSGGTVYVNLRSDSITGTILASSAEVFIPDGFLGVTNFSFLAKPSITPGTTYYLQPIALPGSDGFGAYVTDGSYVGGIAYYSGSAWNGHNLWFQEGVAVPEPSSVMLVMLSGVGLFFSRRHSPEKF